MNEIALATGYEGPEAFARAFRQYAGQSPSEFRAQPDWAEWHSRFPAVHSSEAEHHEHMAAPAPAGAHRHVSRHARRDARTSRQRAAARRSAFASSSSGARPMRCRHASSATFNIIHNDPDETPPEEFRFEPVRRHRQAHRAERAGVRRVDLIPAGRCALLRHVGSDDQLGRLDHAPVRAAGCRRAARSCATSRCSCSD